MNPLTPDDLLRAFAASLNTNPHVRAEQEKATEKLVADLKVCAVSPQREEIIQKARDGYYSDFNSPIAMPKMQLIEDLQRAGFHSIANLATHGKYDG